MNKQGRLAVVDHQLDFALVDAQTEEFEKLAFNVRRLLPAAGAAVGKSVKGLSPSNWSEAWKGRALGALGGSAVGAGLGAMTAGEGQAGTGALLGAAAGAIPGLGIGQLATGQGRRQVGRFLQRQAHGLTGYMPGAYKKEKGIASVFGKGLDPDKRLDILRKMRMAEVPEAKDVEKIRAARMSLSRGDILKSDLAQEKLKPDSILPKRIQEALASLSARRQVALLDQSEKGLTHLPGYVSQMIKDPKGTLTTGALAAGGMGAVGIPFAAPSIYSAIQERDPEALGASLAETGIYAASTGIPMIGSTVLGEGARYVGGIPGRVYKKVIGRDQPGEGSNVRVPPSTY